MGVERGIDLFIKIAKGKPENIILDLYTTPVKPKNVLTDLDFINTKLGVILSKEEVSELSRKALEFSVVWKGKELEVGVPSFRANDIKIPEDIVEEVQVWI